MATVKHFASALLHYLIIALIAGTFAGLFAYKQGRRAAIDEAAPSLRLLADQKQELEAALKLESDDSDKMFVWYERCLDGRSCTEAGEPLKLNRYREPPPLPHMTH